MFTRLSYTTVLGLMLATVFAAAQAPQAPAPQTESSTPAPEVTFRTEVNYVEEDVRVVDRQGNFVKGLKRDDFQLMEDGKPQKVTTFGMVDIPLMPVPKPVFAGRDALPIESDVASNEQVLDGRLYLMVLDDYHVAPLRTQVVRSLARRFVLEKLGVNDQAAVVVTSGLKNASQEFTQNRHLLLQAIDNFVGQKLPSASLKKIDARNRELATQGSGDAGDQSAAPQGSFLNDEDGPERMFKARAALNSVRSIAEWMSAIQGRRKALVLISEGVDYNLYDAFSVADPQQFNFESLNVVQQETWDTISAASRSNVQIYPIDPRGLSNLGQENIEIQDMPRAGSGQHLGTASLLQELQTSQMNLRQLAEETGGVAAVGTNDMTKAFDRIVQENSSYYVLGYYPMNEKRDGKLRRISIKVNGYPDAQVTFRKRYAAPRGKPPKNTAAGKAGDPAAGLTADLMRTLASPLPKTGLPLRITAVPHKGVDKTTDLELVIEASGKELTFTEGGGTFNDILALSIGVFNKEGKSVLAERPNLTLKLKPETHARILQSGIRLMRHLSVPPGRYQIRVAAQDSAKTRQGSAHFDIDVPDFGKDSIALSGIAIAATADGSVINPIDKDPFNGGLPSMPTTIREFPPLGEIAAYVEVYDNRPTPPHGLDITTTVKASDGQVMFTHSDERNSDELHGTPGGFAYSVRIPMANLAPGLYVMTIEAKSRLGNSEAVSRMIQFTVR